MHFAKTSVAEKPQPLLEEVLIAVLHRTRAGELPEKTIEDVVMESSKELRVDPWWCFRPGRLPYSDTLNSCMLSLVVGGSLIRKGATGVLAVSEHTLGAHGEKCYKGLPQELQNQVDMVAQKLGAAVFV